MGKPFGKENGKLPYIKHVFKHLVNDFGSRTETFYLQPQRPCRPQPFALSDTKCLEGGMQKLIQYRCSRHFQILRSNKPYTITELTSTHTLAGTIVASVGLPSCQANSPLSSALSVAIPTIPQSTPSGPGGSSSGGPSPTSDGSQGSSGIKGEIIDNDAEGVWSPDIEQSFQEALSIYPPCGRRKIILSDEGKMYGRNELIARYIKLRTGKTRTRKQVSSHIQVLARRKSREIHSQLKVPRGNDPDAWPYKSQVNSMVDQATKDKVLQSIASMSSAQIVSAGVIPTNPALGVRSNAYQKPPEFSPQYWPGVPAHQEVPDVKPFRNDGYSLPPPVSVGVTGMAQNSMNTNANPLMAIGYPHVVNQGALWQGRQIATHSLRLVDFSAYLEQQRDSETYSKHLFLHINHSSLSPNDPLLESIDIHQIYDKFPEKKSGLRDLFEKGPKEAFFLVKFWADLNVNISEDASTFYAVNTQFESPDDRPITCSTKVCSFGKQVVEKVETEYGRFEGGRYIYRIHRSPMCEYMINFILKLKHLPDTYMMNSVLENFTILQVITNSETGETLLCMAYVFEVSTSEHGAQHHIYQLVGDTKP